ncbi:MAG: ATP-dependent helicase, partial [Planctomycetaceae bacterium]|nr:ATP-dependent helicase [Planctomycetaceae bacterium]
ERNDLRTIEKLIGHKIPVSAEHKLSAADLRQPALETRRPKGATVQRSGEKAARPQRTTRRRSSSAAAAGKPKTGQKRTKWRHLKSNAKQTS